MSLETEFVEAVRKGVSERRALTDSSEGLRSLTRVEIEPVEGLTYQARSITEPFGTMMIDEPRDRGGHEQGPSPLSYFLIGAGACQLNQFIRLGIAREVDIHFRQVQTKGEWHRKAGGGFQHITQEFYAEGVASVDEVEGLVEEAQRFCPVHITLSKAVKITLVVHLNGTEVVRSVTNPTE